MDNENKIFSIAFEGMHRSGKGTQIELLKDKLIEAGIPCISIKGEGYRSGLGNTPEDPKSDFWERMSKELRGGADFELWEEASYRLARELLVWRERILSKEIDKVLAPFGVLLIDRSLISKANLKSLQSPPPPEKIFSYEDLYPTLIQKHKKITVDMVLPDIIFDLIAPKEVLLSRLDKSDPDYDFRKTNIEEKYNLYIDSKKHLPEEITNRIVTIDSSVNSEELDKNISEIIKNKFPEFAILK